MFGTDRFHQPRRVIIAGEPTSLSARIEHALVQAGQPVHRVSTGESRVFAGRAVSRPSRAVLHVALPYAGHRELRTFRRDMADQVFALAGVMSSRPSILVVAEQQDDDGVHRIQRLEGMLTRMRAAAQQELAVGVTVNAVVLSGLVDGGIISRRVCEAVCGRPLPDSDYVIGDQDICTQSIASIITEERS